MWTRAAGKLSENSQKVSSWTSSPGCFYSALQMTSTGKPSFFFVIIKHDFILWFCYICGYIVTTHILCHLVFWLKGLGTLMTQVPVLEVVLKISGGVVGLFFVWGGARGTLNTQNNNNSNCERYLEFHASSHLHLNCRIVFTTAKFEFALHPRVRGFRLRVFPVVVFLMSGVRTIKSSLTHRPALYAAQRLQEVGEKRQI